MDVKYMKIGSLSSELSDVWSLRPKSRYEKHLSLFFVLSTILIYVVILLRFLPYIGLIPVAAFLITGTFIIILEIYRDHYQRISFPVSQLVILILAVYIELYILFSQQTETWGAIRFSLIPNFISIVLGVLFTIRILLGETLKTFETNLQLISSKLRHEFEDNTPKYRPKWLLFSGSSCLLVTFFALIPLWLSVTGYYIYPYILLIPGVLLTVLLMIYDSVKSR
jgi:O-antigen/teichoic acid export membrane protein